MSAETFAPQEYTLADQATADARAQFIVKTYAHLFGAIVATVVLEAVLLASPIGDALADLMFTAAGGWGWLIVLAVFIGMNYLAERWAHDTTSAGVQYAGLSLAVVAWSILLLPVLYIAARVDASIIPTAGVVTLAAFTGLTAIVVVTRKNFSFMGPFLGVAGLVLLGVIVCSVLFGFSLGIGFVGILIAFACGYILYHTSAVMHEYRIGQHVGAAVALYASVALLFYYVVQFFLLSRD